MSETFEKLQMSESFDVPAGCLLALIQKLAVQQFTLEVSNLFTKATTFTPVFRLLYC